MTLSTHWQLVWLKQTHTDAHTGLFMMLFRRLRWLIFIPYTLNHNWSMPNPNPDPDHNQWRQNQFYCSLCCTQLQKTNWDNWFKSEIGPKHFRGQTTQTNTHTYTQTHSDLSATSSCVRPQAFRSVEFSLTSRAALSLASSSLSWVALFRAVVCVSSSFLHAHSSSDTVCICLLTWRPTHTNKKIPSSN